MAGHVMPVIIIMIMRMMVTTTSRPRVVVDDDDDEVVDMDMVPAAGGRRLSVQRLRESCVCVCVWETGRSVAEGYLR